ncbi:hypothetical protein DAI22_12g163900 [Oryza sativa Japonica Group]|nr:hypothetical protein DAI22_12g163900 [Oryza sativa Japonica Group]
MSHSISARFKTAFTFTPPPPPQPSLLHPPPPPPLLVLPSAGGRIHPPRWRWRTASALPNPLRPLATSPPTAPLTWTLSCRATKGIKSQPDLGQENICKLCIGRFKCGEEDVDLKRRWKMERRWKLRLFKITHLIFFQGVERFGD